MWVARKVRLKKKNTHSASKKISGIKAISTREVEKVALSAKVYR